MSQIKTLKTIEEAYNFFNSIPNSKWGTGRFKNNGKCCMYGHCGIEQEGGSDFELEQTGLPKLLRPFIDNELVVSPFWLSNINDDGVGTMGGLGNTPKERVLNALLLVSSGIMEDV